MLNRINVLPRNLILPILILVLFDCGSNHRNENRTISGSLNEQSHIKVDTLRVCDMSFLRTYQKGELLYIATFVNDTVFKRRDYFSAIKFVDFNFDGCDDIKAEVVSRESGECELYLFDQIQNTYRAISNVHPNPTPIIGTNYYYSYERIGCGGDMWQSSLSKIDNFESVQIGIMYDDSCDRRDSVMISQLDANGHEIFFEKRSATFAVESEKKTFIDQYWMSNHSAFK